MRLDRLPRSTELQEASILVNDKIKFIFNIQVYCLCANFNVLLKCTLVFYSKANANDVSA